MPGLLEEDPRTNRFNVIRRISVRWLAAILSVLALSVLLAWLVDKYLPKRLPAPHFRGLPTAHLDAGKLVVRVPESRLIGELARYDDELFAYLMFDYLRTRSVFRGSELLLTYSVSDEVIVYILEIVLPNDFITGIPKLYELISHFPFLKPEFTVIDDRALTGLRNQTQTLLRAYNFPSYQKLEQLSHKDVVAYARRFIRFKSATDPRIRRQIEPVPHALSKTEAQQLAEDIVAVARFYKIPLDFFLGIGAMENNYMNVRGDLGHAVWKPRAQSGDVILRRGRNKVLVLDESLGVWQITTETLRYVHSLYLKDKRDYSLLPEGLRPAKTLDLGDLDPRILTTYAGLLFRDLLDRFKGDVGTAVGAYNGGPGNPNPKYEEGVRLVAQYARRILEQAAVLRGQRVIDARLVRPGMTRGRSGRQARPPSYIRR